METGLLFMTKRFNNIIHKSVEDTDLKETYLSIQIYLDGFSFCVYNPLSNKHIAFQRFDFSEKLKTPENLLREFELTFEKNDLLKQSYKKITVIHQNELVTIVPNEYFSEDHLKDYLKRSVKVLPIDYISYDELTSIDASIVYIPFVNINNFLFQKFGEFDFYHCSTLLIETLKAKQKEDKKESATAYVNVNQNTFEVVIFQKEELILYNTFQFQAAEDFIYYILFVLEQLQLDPNNIFVTLLGDIEKESELYKITYTYIRNIVFGALENPTYLDGFDDISKHSNFVLFNYSQNEN